MPVVSVFYGMTVRIYVPDHDPPHVHVRYGEFSAVISIATGEVMRGGLPKRSLKLFEEWRELHLDELLEAFARAKKMGIPGRIAPLD